MDYEGIPRVYSNLVEMQFGEAPEEGQQRTVVVTVRYIPDIDVTECPTVGTFDMGQHDPYAYLYIVWVYGAGKKGLVMNNLCACGQLRDRSGGEHVCVCVVRVHWMTASFVLVLAFVPLEVSPPRQHVICVGFSLRKNKDRTPRLN